MNPSRQADGAVTDALTLLRHDHRLIAALFTEFELAGPQQLDPLARRVCKMLRIHAQMEAEFFYPVVRSTLREPAMIDRCEAEHADMLQELIRIESLTSDHPDFTEAFQSLATKICSHMQGEEQILFPRLSAATVNLVELGVAMVERRDTLMRILGLSDDEDIPALRTLVDGEAPAAKPAFALLEGEQLDVRERVRQDARRHRAR